jgi:hypothetical protein
MDLLIQLLIWVVVFAILAYGVYWVCTKFFPNFPPALWICGGILLIFLLLFISRQIGVGASIYPLRLK